MGPIVDSDRTDGSWFSASVFSFWEASPAAAFEILPVLLLHRLLFASVVSMYDADRIGSDYVDAAVVPVVLVIAWMFLGLYTASIILDTAPEVIISIVPPDIDSRLLLPTPILLFFDFCIVRLREKK
ncbi:MAG: hypothetical protein JSW61_03545 [Candidatus Thorarchaeota archaeon]|nr:MAG: hypothetical protein JSW61_03545 [Candidatus Thorarchaeota archaeon]